MRELNIAWMYPDLLSLHGDKGNIMALERIGRLLGLKVNVGKIETYGDIIDFRNTDIMFFNPGEIKAIAPIIDALKKQKEALDAYINANKMILLIGTSGMIMAKKLGRNDGTVIEGLNYLDMECKEREYIYGDDIHFQTVDEPQQEIMGCQIQMMDITLNSAAPVGKLLYGRGNKENNAADEGARYKNVIFTNALGPMLVKNPWYCETLIKEAMRQKGVDIEESIDPQEYDFELRSLACINEFIKKKPR